MLSPPTASHCCSEVVEEEQQVAVKSTVRSAANAWPSRGLCRSGSRVANAQNRRSARPICSSSYAVQPRISGSSTYGSVFRVEAASSPPMQDTNPTIYFLVNDATFFERHV